MAEPPVKAVRNPYPGLRPFRTDEERLFFGREHQIDRMIDKLAAHRFLAVVGGSGSGKSSLVNCGLRPALHRGNMASAGAVWRMAQFRPGNDPIGALAGGLAEPGVLFAKPMTGALSAEAMIEATLRLGSLGLVDMVDQMRLPAGTQMLVVVDQFEELFRFRSLARDVARDVYGPAEDAVAFVRLLLEARTQSEVPIHVVLTMRSDFLGDCSQFHGLPEAINEGQYLVPRLTRDETRAAIIGPAAVADATVSAVLLTRLLNDVGDNPDQLSILQHALNRTWSQWEYSGDKGPLELAHYEAIGTMAHALDRHAERAYAELATERQKQICEKLFKALTDKATDPRGVRRASRLGTLCTLAAATEAEVTEVIDVFRKPSRSFLMPPAEDTLESETVIDISHESLMRVWERLKIWADEEAKSAQIYSRLAETAVLHGEGKAGLLHDPDLQVALDWREKNQPNQDWAQRYDPGFERAIAFLQASEKKRADEAAELERQQNAELDRARRELEQGQALAEAQRQQRLEQGQRLEQQRRLEQQARASARLRRLLAALVVLALLALASSVFAFVAYKKAETARRKAVDSDLHGRRLNYVSNMNVASQSDATGNGARVNELLESFLDTDDLRSFYWYYLWHQNHNELATLKGNSGEVHSVAFSADGRTLASASGYGTVKLWDTSTRRELATLKGHSDPVYAVAFSPDGKTLASASADRTVKLWDTSTRQELATLKSGSDIVYSIVFSPDGKTLASGSGDGIVRLWDTGTRQMLTNFRAHEEGVVNSVAFSPDGKTIASAGADGTVNLRDTGTGEEMATLEGHMGAVNSVAFSPDGKTLALAGRDQFVNMWDIRTGHELAKLKGHTGPVLSVAFSPDGKTLASASGDGTVKLWDSGTRLELTTLKGHSDSAYSVAFSPDGKTLASASADKTVKLWDSSTRQELTTLKGHSDSVYSVAFSPDGKTLASASADKTVKLWDTSTRQVLAILSDHSDRVYSVVFSPDGKTLASASADQTVKLWDTNTWREVATLKGHTGDVNAVAFSPDGKTLASAGDDQTVRLWDVRTGQELATLRGHSDKVYAVVFSPDGKTLVSAGNDKTVKLWDAGTRQELATLRGHSAIVFGVTFSLDGKTLASASGDQTVKLWDTSTRQELATLRGHSGAVGWVAFSPDGKTLASASDDQTVKLWDTGTWRELATLKGHSDFLTSVAFSPDGKTLASASGDRTVRLWIAATDQEVVAHRNK